jgi:hypothetical protein
MINPRVMVMSGGLLATFIACGVAIFAALNGRRS